MKSNQAVLVTGASTGIGAAAALEFAQLGFTVFAGVRKESDGAALATQNQNITPVILEVTDETSIEKARDFIVQRLKMSGTTGDDKKLTILVNNAGIVVGGPLEFVPLQDFRKQFEVNTVGLLAVTQCFIPLLRNAPLGKARIVNVGSISGRVAYPMVGPYCASKFAVEALSDALRMELVPWNIHVSVIEPGPVQTPIWQKTLTAHQESRKSLPPLMLKLYGVPIERMSATAADRAANGVLPKAVVRAIVQAATARCPKARYLVGTSAWIEIFSLWLPRRLREWAVTKYLGLR